MAAHVTSRNISFSRTRNIGSFDLEGCHIGLFKKTVVKNTIDFKYILLCLKKAFMSLTGIILGHNNAQNVFTQLCITFGKID